MHFLANSISNLFCKYFDVHCSSSSMLIKSDVCYVLRLYLLAVFLCLLSLLVETNCFWWYLCNQYLATCSYQYVLLWGAWFLTGLFFRWIIFVLFGGVDRCLGIVIRFLCCLRTYTHSYYSFFNSTLTFINHLNHKYLYLVFIYYYHID